MTEPTQGARLIEVEKLVAAQGVLVTKFDAALDKISELSINVSKLLAVHEQRLEVQEQTGKELFSVIESRRNDMSVHVNSLNTRITNTDQELRREMTNGQKEILNEIKSLRHDLTEQAEEMKTELQNHFESKIEKVDTRVSKLERFVYIAIGGASVVTFAITEIVSWFGGIHGK